MSTISGKLKLKAVADPMKPVKCETTFQLHSASFSSIAGTYLLTSGRIKSNKLAKFASLTNLPFIPMGFKTTELCAYLRNDVIAIILKV